MYVCSAHCALIEFLQFYNQDYFANIYLWRCSRLIYIVDKINSVKYIANNFYAKTAKFAYNVD